ncbi:DUF6148 family protein [Paenibacillus contaminans]|uniref:Uncharacterized protein n=1 Tax=Paenibacillus contaminans TaxID=450362 RepID=A0A329MG77_9BACL|nr:DUF6148 family protein [Paenibacillus contaminans]RAV18820.1 hypothetical protein DQG23_24125 [Paenibacillus contaminans]
MSQYTLEVAQKHLNAWLAAELALSTGKEYRIGTRSLTRVDLTDVMTQIRYWQKQVDDAQRDLQGLGKRKRVRRYVPIDY